MKRYGLRIIGLLVLLSVLPACSGCGGGVVELVLTAKKLYGIWKLYQVFNDGTPSWIQAASALWKFKNDMGYELTYYDGSDNAIATETGTWVVDNGVLVLNVDSSTIDPSLEGETVRLPGHFKGQAANTLSLTRRVQQGQVTVSQEQVFQRQPGS